MQKRLLVCCIFLIALVLVAGCGNNRVSKAKDLMKIESYDEAIDLLKEEIKDNPDNGEAQFVYGQVLRHQGDDIEACDRFNKAIKVDESFKEKVKDFLLNDKCAGGDTDYSHVAEIMPDLETEDADFCYEYKVERTGDPIVFVNNFPTDKRAPKALSACAAQEYEDNRAGSKSLYQRLMRDYPETTEAKSAKRKLGDWWACYNLDVPLDSEWHGYRISEGQEYRYEIVGEREYDYGGQGILRIDSDDMGMFVGTEPELTEAVEYAYGYSGRKVDYDLQRIGSGTAPTSGYIWFRVSTAGELSGSFTVKLEYKE